HVVYFCFVKIESVDNDVAARLAGEPENHSGKGGLAASALCYKSDYLSLMYVEGYVVNGLDICGFSPDKTFCYRKIFFQAVKLYHYFLFFVFHMLHVLSGDMAAACMGFAYLHRLRIGIETPFLGIRTAVGEAAPRFFLGYPRH